MTTTTQDAGRQIALDQIRVPDNVRALDDAHVQALAGSIALQGILVPVVVRNDGDRFELVAGFHRIAAARSLGLTEVPVVVRDGQTEDADRAVENITRKQLNAYEPGTMASDATFGGSGDVVAAGLLPVRVRLGRSAWLGDCPARVYVPVSRPD